MLLVIEKKKGKIIRDITYGSNKSYKETYIILGHDYVSGRAECA
jgi:hypothetical protein